MDTKHLKLVASNGELLVPVVKPVSERWFPRLMTRSEQKEKPKGAKKDENDPKPIA